MFSLIWPACRCCITNIATSTTRTHGTKMVSTRDSRDDAGMVVISAATGGWNRLDTHRYRRYNPRKSPADLDNYASQLQDAIITAT